MFIEGGPVVYFSPVRAICLEPQYFYQNYASDGDPAPTTNGKG